MSDLLAAVRRRIAARVPLDRRALVAVDGVGGSGKTVFAQALAESIVDRPALLLHADDFFNPPAVRHARGRFSPDGFWLDAYDYDALVADAIEPLRSGAPTHRPAVAAAPRPHRPTPSC